MENKTITSKSVTRNFFWRFAERWGAKGVNFVVSIILARLLMPSDYGLIAIVTVIISILDVFVDSGLANALIQKKDADDLDFSSVFYFNIFFCFLLYTGLFFMAPLIGELYQFQQLPGVLRVLGLTMIISGVKNTQMSYVSKNMQFKKFFYATLGGTFIAAFVGIIMAYLGFGVWSIVAQYLINNLIDTIILWVCVTWRPKMIFSFMRLKKLLSFGWKILASNLLEKVYSNIQAFIIGAKYSPTDLGLYNKGMSFPVFLVENINSSINSVLLPTMSSSQDDILVLKNMTRRSIKISTYILAPMMIGLFFVASPIIRLLLTDKWLPCVPYLRVFCIVYLLYPIQSVNMNAILAKGRSDIYLKTEMIKKIIGVITLIIAMRIGVIAIAYSLLLVGIVSVLINAYLNSGILNYKIREQLADILPNMLLALGMGVCVFFIQFIKLPNIIILIIQVFVGVVIYLLGSIVFKIDSFEYLIKFIKPMLKKRMRR